MRRIQRWLLGEDAPDLTGQCVSPEGRLSAKGSCISVLLPASQGGSIHPQEVSLHKIPPNKAAACSAHHSQPAGKPGVTARLVSISTGRMSSLFPFSTINYASPLPSSPSSASRRTLHRDGPLLPLTTLPHFPVSTPEKCLYTRAARKSL